MPFVQHCKITIHADALEVIVIQDMSMSTEVKKLGDEATNEPTETKDEEVPDDESYQDGLGSTTTNCCGTEYSKVNNQE